jgi:vitamin B12 transporter
LPATASVRGAASAQTPVYLAGVRLNDDVGGSADLSTVPLWFVNRIEIYRSNAPLAGDQLGIGGAIFFEPRRPEGHELSAGLMAGSFGARSAWAGVGFGSQTASALVGARVDGAENDYSYLNDGGTRFDRSHDRTSVFSNADVRRFDVWAIGSARLGDAGHADLVVNVTGREQGMQTFALFPAASARASSGRRLAAFTTRVPCSAAGCTLTTTTSVISTRVQYDDPLREVGLGTNRLDLDAMRIEDGLALRWSLSRLLSVTPTARAALERLTIHGQGSPTAAARRVFSRAALQGEWRGFHPVILRALASAECHGTSLAQRLPWSSPGDVSGPTGAGRLCGQLEPAMRAGLEVDASLATLLLNVGRYARVPTLAELYGVSGAVRGNTALSPETGLSLEAGARSTRGSSRALGGASLDIFGFVRWSTDLISYQRSAIGYVRPFNIGAARTLGLELQAAYQPFSFLSIDMAVALLDPRDTSRVRPRNDLLPYQAQVTLSPRVELRGQFRGKVVKVATASATYFYESSRYADRAGLIVMPPQGSLDVETELRLWTEHVAVRGRVANALGQTRFDLIGYPLPGRAAYLAMETDWR